MRKSQYGNSAVSRYDSNLNVQKKPYKKNRQWNEKGMNNKRKSRSLYGWIQEKSKATIKSLLVYSQGLSEMTFGGLTLSCK